MNCWKGSFSSDGDGVTPRGAEPANGVDVVTEPNRFPPWGCIRAEYGTYVEARNSDPLDADGLEALERVEALVMLISGEIRLVPSAGVIYRFDDYKRGVFAGDLVLHPQSG